MKIYLEQLSNNIEEVLPREIFENMVQEVPCSHKDCNGKIHYLLKQTQDGSALICNKCKRAVIIKMTEI